MTRSHELVDIDFALSQLGGNSDLLSRMLDKFKNEFCSTPNDVKSLIAEGDMKEAKLKIHTTKGLSGNLGLMALFECSKILDQQLREDTVEKAQIAEFETIMRETCDRIGQIDLQLKNAPDFSQAVNTNSNYKTILLARLKRKEFIDDDTLDEYVNSLSLNESDKHKVKTYVEELQYDSAIDILNQIE